MIVFIGDWVKISGQWRQVVDVNPGNDTFSIVANDWGEQIWYGTETPEIFGGHCSDPEFQTKLQGAGL